MRSSRSDVPQNDIGRGSFAATMYGIQPYGFGPSCTGWSAIETRQRSAVHCSTTGYDRVGSSPLAISGENTWRIWNPVSSYP